MHKIRSSVLLSGKPEMPRKGYGKNGESKSQNHCS